MFATMTNVNAAIITAKVLPTFSLGSGGKTLRPYLHIIKRGLRLVGSADKGNPTQAV